MYSNVNGPRNITGQEATSGLICLAFDMYLAESYSQKNNKRE